MANTAFSLNPRHSLQPRRSHWGQWRGQHCHTQEGGSGPHFYRWLHGGAEGGQPPKATQKSGWVGLRVQGQRVKAAGRHVGLI